MELQHSREHSRGRGGEGEDTTNAGVDGEEADIDEDAYGAAVVAIIKEMQEISAGPGRHVLFCLFRLAFAEGILIINILLQWAVLMFIETHVVETSITRVQWLYKDFHEKVFDEDRNLVESLWTIYENKDELCQIGMTNHTFFIAILFLWTMNQMKELRDAARFIGNLIAIKRVDSARDMIRGTPRAIVGLTTPVRVSCIVFVLVPKIVICLRLLLLGMRWLSATTSFESLVMNTVAMEFVVQIDETLYAAIMPTSYRMQVVQLNFFIEGTPKTEGQARREEWAGYQKSMLYLSCATALVFFFASSLQDVLPDCIDDVKDVCNQYLAGVQPVCDIVSLRLQGESTTSCFPFGAPTGEAGEL